MTSSGDSQASHPMRILFLSREYPPRTDGIGAYVACAARALAGRGHEVRVLSCREQEVADDRDGAVIIHRRPLLRGRRLAPLLRAPAAANRLWTSASCLVWLRRLGWQPDVVEAPDWMAEALMTPRRSVPLVAHLHTPMRVVADHNRSGWAWNEWFADSLERRSVRRAHVVTAPSTLLVRTLRDVGWLPGNREIEVIPYPIDLDRWQDVPDAAETAPTVLAVGRLEARKAPEVVVDAVAELAESVPGAEVVFVGRSGDEREGRPYHEWVEDYASQRGVACEIVAHLDRARLVDWYARARVLALASTFDNFPMVALEAMAAGRAVVCTDRTGTADLLAGSNAGAVVPVGDASALAAALRPYLVDPARAASAGAAARELVAAHCRPDRVAARREACYGRAIAAAR